MSPFPRTAMMAWSLAVVIFGIVLMGGAFAATDGLTVALYKLLGGGLPDMTPALRFSVGLMGAVSTGWGLTLLAVASISDRLDREITRILWTRIAYSAIIWYIVDSAISVATGFALNAVSNTILLVAFLLILQRIRAAA